jgi:hypothetical protein
MCCKRCDGTLVVIEMALAGSEARMLSCSTCDAREWVVDGRRVGLDEVLAAVPNRRDDAA